MKKIMLTLIGIFLILSLAGCNNDEKKDPNPTGDSEISQNENVDRDEVISIYNSKIDEVKKFFEANNITFEETKDKDGNLFIKGENDLITCNYRLFHREEGISPSIDASALLAIDSEKVNSEGFKFEESILNEFRDIFVDKALDIEAVNKSIKDYYRDYYTDKFTDDAYVDSDLGENLRESIEYDIIYMNYAWSREFK